jgi:hypothetical protein
MPLTSFGIGVGYGLEFVRGPVGGTSPLLTDLAEVWEMDETSGNRSGAHAGLVLTDNNTVGSASGKLGNAARFIAANNEYLSLSGATDLLAGVNGFTIAAWVKPDVVNQTQQIAGVWEGTTLTDQYRIGILSSGEYFAQIRNNAGTTALAKIAGSAVAGAWRLVFGWYDPTAETINIQVFDGSTNPTSSISFTDTLNVPPSPLFNVAKGGAAYYDGLIDQTLVWQQVPSLTERTDLWNSNAGLVYPF